MSPHKPDPLPRKVDVDISSILIRSEELDRLGAKYEQELENVFPSAERDSSNNARMASISSSEWASITFAVGACFIGVICTLWTFDDLDQLTRLVYPAPDAIYVRPQLRIGRSADIVSQKPQRPVRTQSSEPAGSTLKEATDPSGQAPPLSMFSPIFEDNGWPLLSSGESVGGSSPAQPTGIGRSSMSENGGPVAQGPNAGQKLSFKPSTKETSSRHSRKSIAVNKTFSIGQIFANHSGMQSVQRTRTSGTTLSRATMSMNSHRNGASMLQNRSGLNSMHMQHGMGAQPQALPGLNVGLNGAGLGGGLSGGKHAGANARR